MANGLILFQHKQSIQEVSAEAQHQDDAM